MLRFLTAGESHGPALTVIVEGLPAGLPVDLSLVNADLRRRQQGYGRGQRMAIESDEVEVLGGIRRGETMGGPVAMIVRNRDWKNWQKTMNIEDPAPEDATGATRGPVTRPRPGHADLAGGLKYNRDDLRDILERASARETTMRVAGGALAKQLLAHVGVEVLSHVFRVGDVAVPADREVTVDQVRAIPATSLLHCVDPTVDEAMARLIDRAKSEGDTLGGAFEVIAAGVPVGLGSHVQWDRKLDGRLAQAIMSIHAIKAVGIGLGPVVAERFGSKVHDEITLAAPGAETGTLPRIARPTNRAGGLEGGVTNGEPVRVTGYMKPISTLMQPLRSVDLPTMVESAAAIERSDVCAISAAAVVGEAMVAFVLADALLERFGGDTAAGIRQNLETATRGVHGRLAAAPAGSGQSGR
ncbi:MAG: chorismate synthase [Vicinamibacterales bacterium]